MAECCKTLPKVLSLQNIDFENITFLEVASCNASIKYYILIYFVVFNVFFVQIQRPVRFKTYPQTCFGTILKLMDGSIWRKKWWLQYID